jgi:hypothetical protein
MNFIRIKYFSSISKNALKMEGAHEEGDVVNEDDFEGGQGEEEGAHVEENEPNEEDA